MRYLLLTAGYLLLVMLMGFLVLNVFGDGKFVQSLLTGLTIVSASAFTIWIRKQIKNRPF
ncbi:hypothetical protein [Apilactobacillus xinyiensis]|uniref:hypothetical protein n=1 Tax=Apilactobacillus xinyiensis TaxID=2841032 RepID=UPI001C7CD127|nr:hypothetical protein [Apilactobacillus xinyiensis]MCL0312261.1 hypothetical protein [Apilactobacillus xinyiensis]